MQLARSNIGWAGKLTTETRNITLFDLLQLQQSAEDTSPAHILVVADPQILDHRSYPSRPAFLSFLTRLVVDLNLRKNWNVAIAKNPDSVVFLGDMMDGGRMDMSDSEYVKPSDKRNVILVLNFCLGTRNILLVLRTYFGQTGRYPSSSSQGIMTLGKLSSYPHFTTTINYIIHPLGSNHRKNSLLMHASVIFPTLGLSTTNYPWPTTPWFSLTLLDSF
jgi:hypothetical protein